MKWYTIDKDYIEYLKKYDDKVPNVDYSNKLKPFIGIILHTNDVDYFCPVTSFKTKFMEKRNNLAFQKIVDNDSTALCALLINNMIPVPKTECIEITYDNIVQFRSFSSETTKQNYLKLLNKELLLISTIESKLYRNAEKLYTIQLTSPNNPICRICCDFQLLEVKCKDYELMNQQKSLYPNEIMNESIAKKVLGNENFIRCIGEKIYVLDQQNLDKNLETLQHIYGSSLTTKRCFGNYSQLLAQYKEQIISDYFSLQDEEIFYLSADEMTYLNIDQHEKSIAPVMSDSEKELDISF